MWTTERSYHSAGIYEPEQLKDKQIGVSPEGKALGYHTATGILPMRMEHFRSEGEDVKEELFAPIKQPSPDKLY